MLYPSLTCRTHCNVRAKCAAETSAVRCTSVVPGRIRAGLNTAKLACNSPASPLYTMPSKNSTSADKPFDSSSKANIILRSSNGVDFFVMKGLLQLVSPVFDRMISELLDEREVKDSNDDKNELSTTPRENGAPHPRRPVFNMIFKGRKAKSNNKAKHGLPIIPLDEDSTTLYNLLLLIYPCSKEPPCTVEVYLKVGDAARKYGMDEAWEKLRNAARRATEDAMAKAPFRAFAIASYFGLADVMKEAARNTLKIPLHDLGECEELRLLTISAYHDLLQWRFACRDAVKHMLVKLESQANSPVLVRLLRERLETTDCPWIAPDIEVMSEILADYAHTWPLPYPEVVKSCRLADGEVNKVLPMVCHKIPAQTVIA
jgi:hypothetical protein